MQKWVKVGTENTQAEVSAKPTSAYSRAYEVDYGKQEQLTNQLREMTKAHNSASASNKAIRNGFYGTKD
jgi:hypothetical protein